MRIFLETLSGIKFHVDVDPKDKVSELKKKVSLSDPTTLLLKFFFQEKELNHRTTLEENQVRENSSIFLMSIEKSRPSGWWQRGRVPRGGGGGGAGLFLPPDSWLWIALIIVLLSVVATYYEALMTSLVRPIAPVPIPPVPIPPVPVPVPNVVVPPPPILDYEKNEEDEEYFMDCTLAVQWPKSHVLNKKYRNILLVPQDRVTLHGLWPDDEDTFTSSLDFDCSMGNDEELIQYASKNWPNLDPRDPGVELIEHNCKFWKGEWDKHGVHSGLTQEVYMELALALFSRVALPLNEFLREAMKLTGASSSSSKPPASTPDVFFVNINNLEYSLSTEFEMPKILCRTPGQKEIFHSVNFKVRVKVKKDSSASALPFCQFIAFRAAKQCSEVVILP